MKLTFIFVKTVQMMQGTRNCVICCYFFKVFRRIIRQTLTHSFDRGHTTFDQTLGEFIIPVK